MSLALGLPISKSMRRCWYNILVQRKLVSHSFIWLFKNIRKHFAEKYVNLPLSGLPFVYLTIWTCTKAFSRKNMWAFRHQDYTRVQVSSSACLHLGLWVNKFLASCAQTVDLFISQYLLFFISVWVSTLYQKVSYIASCTWTIPCNTLGVAMIVIFGLKNSGNWFQCYSR